jgi:ribosomal protein S18 acetylase RimI-like enzyme
MLKAVSGTYEGFEFFSNRVRRGSVMSIQYRFHEPEICTIWGVSIKEEFQGKGYGKQMMKETLDAIRHHGGIKKVYLNVREDNTIARKLYESLGFKYTGKRYAEKALWMELEL